MARIIISESEGHDPDVVNKEYEIFHNLVGLCSAYAIPVVREILRQDSASSEFTSLLETAKNNLQEMLDQSEELDEWTGDPQFDEINQALLTITADIPEDEVRLMADTFAHALVRAWLNCLGDLLKSQTTVKLCDSLLPPTDTLESEPVWSSVIESVTFLGAGIDEVISIMSDVSRNLFEKEESFVAPGGISLFPIDNSTYSIAAMKTDLFNELHVYRPSETESLANQWVEEVINEYSKLGNQAPVLSFGHLMEIRPHFCTQQPFSEDSESEQLWQRAVGIMSRSLSRGYILGLSESKHLVPKNASRRRLDLPQSLSVELQKIKKEKHFARRFRYTFSVKGRVTNSVKGRGAKGKYLVRDSRRKLDVVDINTIFRMANTEIAAERLVAEDESDFKPLYGSTHETYQ